MYSTRYSCQILTKLEFSGRTFEKLLNITLDRGHTVCLKYNNNNKIKYVLRLTKLCLFCYYYYYYYSIIIIIVVIIIIMLLATSFGLKKPSSDQYLQNLKCLCILIFCKYWPDVGLLKPKLEVANNRIIIK